MSREIKFRAWNPRDEQMGKVIELCEDTIKIEYEDGSTQDWIRSGFHLMQYTGLKDKNGVDIYEGDVVVYSTQLHLFNKRKSGKYCKVVEWVNCGFNLSPALLWKENNNGYVVVGNTYEGLYIDIIE